MFDRRYLVGLLVRTHPQWSIGTCIETVDHIYRHLPCIQRGKEASCIAMVPSQLERYERVGNAKFKALAKYLVERGIKVTTGSGDPRGPTVELTITNETGSIGYSVSGEGFTADEVDFHERWARG